MGADAIKVLRELADDIPWRQGRLRMVGFAGLDSGVLRFDDAAKGLPSRDNLYFSGQSCMSDPGTRNLEPEAAMTFPWRARVWKCLARSGGIVLASIASNEVLSSD